MIPDKSIRVRCVEVKRTEDQGLDLESLALRIQDDNKRQ